MRRLATYVAVVTALAATSVLPSAQAATTTPMANTGSVLVQARVNDQMHIDTHRPSDVLLTTVSIDPHSSGRWHYHDGEVIVTIAQGTATQYFGDDPKCRPHRYTAGQGFFEHPHHVHIVRNEGDTPLVMYVVTVSGAGQPSSVGADTPGNCPF